jgi:hypothetical protein
MAERKGPSSASCNELLSYFMYSNAGPRPSNTTHLLVEDLMAKEGISEDVRARYVDFYSPSTGITMCWEEHWNKTFLVFSVFHSIESLVSNCPSSCSERDSSCFFSSSLLLFFSSSLVLLYSCTPVCAVIYMKQAKARKAESVSKGFSEQRWGNMMHEIVFQVRHTHICNLASSFVSHVGMWVCGQPSHIPCV